MGWVNRVFLAECRVQARMLLIGSAYLATIPGTAFSTVVHGSSQIVHDSREICHREVPIARLR